MEYILNDIIETIFTPDLELIENIWIKNKKDKIIEEYVV
jgi:hypothetical protein